MTPSFRKRIPTEHPLVDKYVFTNPEKDEKNEEIENDIQEYKELQNISKQWKDQEKKERSISESQVHTLQRLKQKISAHYNKRIQECCKSILKDSVNESEHPWRTGCDSEVYESSNGKHVYKYSMPTYTATPLTIEYLRHKYALLKKYLGEYIPKSSFFLGERYRKVKNKNPESALDIDIRAITIQTRIQGKTFKEMTDKERTRPEVIEALKKAHYKYITAKKIIADTCSILGFDRKLLDIKLDIGYLSKKENDPSFNEKSTTFSEEKIQTFSSPNIIYSEEKKQVFFFDYDLKEWSDEQQKVFDFIMNK